MRRYRKRPIVVEAIQLTEETFAECLEFIGDENWVEADKEEIMISIETLEGISNASDGNYIIKGIAGEFYPCREYIFNSTYDLVDDE